MVCIQSIFHFLVKLFPDFRSVPIANGLNKELLQRVVLEDLSQYVEDLATKGLTFFF